MFVTFVAKYEISEECIDKIMENDRSELGNFDYFNQSENDILDVMNDILCESEEYIDEKCNDFENDIIIDEECKNYIKKKYNDMYNEWLNENDDDDENNHDENIKEICDTLFEIKTNVNELIKKLEILK